MQTDYEAGMSLELSGSYPIAGLGITGPATSVLEGKILDAVGCPSY